MPNAAGPLHLSYPLDKDKKSPAWRRPTLPGPCGPSTIGAGGLNGRVRDGYAWNPSAIITRPDRFVPRLAP